MDAWPGPFVQSCGFWTSWLPGLLGLIGTSLLAYATWRAIPIARKSHDVMHRLLELDEKIVERARQAERVDTETGGTDAETGRRLEELDRAEREMLEAVQHDLDAARLQWTVWDTRRTVTGVVLTLLSYAVQVLAFLPAGCG